jgi:CheY-like chemotaxis protein
VISFFYIILLCLHKFYDILFSNFLYLHLLGVVLMVKILLADTDTKRNSASYQFLSNEKDFEIESTNDGISTIKKYLEIEPNIFVIDSNFTDIKTLDIIDRLSVSPLERRKKNTILTISETKETFLLENVLKVYQVLYRPYLILFHVFLNFPHL